MYSLFNFKNERFVKRRFVTVWGARLYAFVNQIKEYMVFPFQRYVTDSDAIYSSRKEDVEPPPYPITGNAYINTDQVKKVQDAALRMSQGETLLVNAGGV